MKRFLIAAFVIFIITAFSACDLDATEGLFETLFSRDADFDHEISYRMTVEMYEGLNQSLLVMPERLEISVNGMVYAEPYGFDLIVGIIADDFSERVNVKYVDDRVYIEIRDGLRAMLNLLAYIRFIDENVLTLVETHIDFSAGGYISFSNDHFERFADSVKGYLYALRKSEIDDFHIISAGARIAPFHRSGIVPNIGGIAAIDGSELFGSYIERTQRIASDIPASIEVILTIEDDISMLYAMISSRDGSVEIIRGIPLASDISPLFEDRAVRFSERVLPLRLIAELCGREVMWNAETGRAYVIHRGAPVHMPGVILEDNRTYISAAQLPDIGINVNISIVGEFISMVLNPN